MFRNFGKIPVCAIYGDSISTTDFSGGGYQELLREHLGIEKIYNHAVSASGTARGTPNSVVEILDNPENIHEDANLIIIWSGTNDWHWNVQPGNIMNFSEQTYSGALRKAISRLSTAAPTANIVLLTPIVRYSAPDGMSIEGDAFYYRNAAGFTLNDYYETLTAIARSTGCALCDMRLLSGFNMQNKNIFLRDNVHPSRLGYLRIAEIIAAFTDSLSFVNCIK